MRRHYAYKSSLKRFLTRAIDAVGDIAVAPWLRGRIIPSPEFILVIRLDHLGDVITTLPLLEHLSAHWPQASLVTYTSAAGAVLHVKKQKWGFSVPTLTLFLFFVLQPALVKLPFRQYQYTLYLAAAAPLALLIHYFSQQQRTWIIYVICGFMFTGALSHEIKMWQFLNKRFPVQKQIDAGNFLLGLCPPGSLVAAQIPYHPVFRRDAVFAWCETRIPHGPPSGQILATFPGLGTHFSDEGINKELTLGMPGLIVLSVESSGSIFDKVARHFAEDKGPKIYLPISTAFLQLYQRLEPTNAQPSK
jgi:hypothetical protein